MAQPVLTNAQAFTFKGQDLYGSCEGWSDELPVRLAQYEYIKTDGGEQEPMGAGVKTFTFSCVFMGPDCGQRYQALAASIQQEPRGQLVHPRLGTFAVACRGVRGRESPATAIDVIEFTIEFVENQVATLISSDGLFGVQLHASQARDAAQNCIDAISAALANRIANTVYAAATAAATDLRAWINKFAERSVQSAQQSLPDPVLDKLLQNLKSKRDAAVNAFVAILPYTLQPEVSITDARTAAYIAYAASVQLYQAIVSTKPQIVDFVVPAAMPLTHVLVRLYGAQAMAQRSSVMLLNRIPTPYWIQAGTTLRVVSPTAVAA